MTNNLPFLQLLLSLCTTPHPSLNCLICVARISASAASPSSLSDHWSLTNHPRLEAGVTLVHCWCHLGQASSHLHCLLCALIGRVAGSQWLDCQMTSKKGFKLVETFVNPSHQLVMELVSRKHAAVSPFVRFKAFVPAQNDHQRQIPHSWRDLAQPVCRDQFGTFCSNIYFQKLFHWDLII